MPDHEYLYFLTLDHLDGDVARFGYIEATMPQADDTALLLNRPSWEKLGRPSRLRVTMRVEPADE